MAYHQWTLIRQAHLTNIIPRQARPSSLIVPRHEEVEPVSAAHVTINLYLWQYV